MSTLSPSTHSTGRTEALPWTREKRFQDAGTLSGGRYSPDPTFRRDEENSLPALYKHFSGHERAEASDRQGADARRDATSGQIVCFYGPGAGALDQESPGSIPGGATRSAMRG
jgi:hypothetical protein